MLKILFTNRDYIILFIASPLVIQSFFMFPMFLEYNFPFPCFNGEKIAVYGCIFYLSGMLGGLMITTLITMKYGKIKYWAIFVSLCSSLSALAIHAIGEEYKENALC